MSTDKFSNDLTLFKEETDYNTITFTMQASDNSFLNWDNVSESTEMYKFMKNFLYHVVIHKRLEKHWTQESKEGEWVESEWQNYISRLISHKTSTKYACNKLYIEDPLEYPDPYGYYRLWSGVAVNEGHHPRLIKVSGYKIKTDKYNLIKVFGDNYLYPPDIKDKLMSEDLPQAKLFVKFTEFIKRYSGGISNRKKYTRKEIKSEKNIQDNKPTKKDNKPTKKDNKPTKKDNKPTKKDNKPLKTK